MAMAKQQAMPAWIVRVRRSIMAGEAGMFLVDGDVAGYAGPGISQMSALSRTMGQGGVIVAYYDRARGITFNTKSDHDAAAKLLRDAEQQAEVNRRSSQQPTGQNAQTRDMLRAIASGAAAVGVEDGDPFEDTAQPRVAVAVLEKLLTAKPDAVAVVIKRADLLIPDANKGMMSPDDRTLLAGLLNWASDPKLADMGNPIIMMCARREDVHADLRAADSGILSVNIPLPDRAARLAYIQWYITNRAEEAASDPNTPAITLADGLTVEELANNSAGLSLRHIENILLLAAAAGSATRALVKGAKDEIIASENSDVAEMIEPLPQGFGALGGADYLIGFLQTDIIDAVRAGRMQDVPKGVLLVGPPGTGKTFIVRALAQEIGFNAVALRAENILGGIVGESERKLRQFFGFVKALAPTLVFVDEIDQSDMSRRGNGSGNPVAANLFNQMLQFLSDETLRGKVIMVMASNRPDLLDSALKRNGRMDAIIPVLLPEADDRAAIIKAQARGQNVTISDAVAAKMADDSNTSKYSAADLAAIVSKARKLAARAGKSEITWEHAQRALSLIRPDTTKADEYTRLAVLACNDAEYLPPKWAALLENRQQSEEQAEDDSDRLSGSRRRGRDVKWG